MVSAAAFIVGLSQMLPARLILQTTQCSAELTLELGAGLGRNRHGFPAALPYVSAAMLRMRPKQPKGLPTLMHRRVAKAAAVAAIDPSASPA